MSKRPNIIYLLNDHQAFYGHDRDFGPKIQRPYFERLASEGIVFNRAYCVYPLCGPARRSMLCGQYPHNHGECGNDKDVPFTDDTYLDILKKEGYQSYYFGKWHAGPGTAYDHGCEGFCLPGYNNPYIQPEYEDYLKRKHLEFPKVRIEHSYFKQFNLKEYLMSQGQPTDMVDDAMEKSVNENMVKQFGPGQTPGELYEQKYLWSNEPCSGIMQGPKEAHESFFLASLACDQLEKIAQSGDNRPFALRVDFWGPHHPYFPTQEFADMYDSKDIPEYPSFSENVFDNKKPEVYQMETNGGISEHDRLIYPNPVPWEVWQKDLALEYAQTTLIDEAGGMILDKLKELGLDDNTLIIWTTDHGDAIASHGGHFDKDCYMPEEMLRVPMAMKYQGVIPFGQVSNELVSNLDVAQTMLDAAGAAFTTPVDGISLMPVASGRERNVREYVVSETYGHKYPHLGRALMTQRYKYVYNEGQIEELYDLAVDPYELRNLYDEPEYQELKADMREKLIEWGEKYNDRDLLESLKKENAGSPS